MAAAVGARSRRRSKEARCSGSESACDRVDEIQRARIVRAAAEACVELGAANVKVSSIVERSGVSRRTFYELYRGCEDCLDATFEEGLGGLSAEMDKAYQGEGRWQERVRAALIAMLAFIEEEPFMGRLLALELPAVGSRSLACRRQLLACAVAAIDEGREVHPNRVDLPALMAEGIVGGVLSVVQSRVIEPDGRSLLDLVGGLMSMIVLPYLGASAARSELARPAPVARGSRGTAIEVSTNPLRGMDMRLTYRTVCVLGAVAGEPGSSNRAVGLASGIADQGQISKLLTRLAKLGLVENAGGGQARGAPNAWTLTARGAEVQRMIGASSG